MNARVTARLGEVCELITRGITPKYLEEGGTLVINQKCVRDHSVNYGLGRRHDPAARPIAADRFIRRGDALVNSTGTGTLGRVAQIRHDPPEAATVDTHVTIVRPHPQKFHPDFFGYIMIALEDQLTASGTGLGGQTELGRKTIEAFEVCFPQDIEEQRRIVAALDEAFAAIATATANTEKNLANARELPGVFIEAILAAEPNQRSMTLAEAVDPTCTLSYGIVQPGDDLDNGLPIVRPVDLQQEVVGLGGLKRINPKIATTYQRTTLRGDEIFLCVRGTTGTVALASPELAGGNVTRGIVPIRFDPTLVSRAFGNYLMRSAAVQKQIRAATYGTALMQINVGDLKKIVVRIPRLARQEALSERLDRLTAELGALQDAYSQKVAALSQLKQSLLRRAFSGEPLGAQLLAA